MAYCTVEEGCIAAPKPSRPPKPNPPPSNGVDAALVSVFIRDERDRPRRCFLYIGKARSLPAEDPFMQELIREFYTSGDLSKHFRLTIQPAS
ncbi:hypothetical protein F5Y16DRAFT_406872 [Xylariaceae sp. FL0255]|nr:hypothetical protein F5Y16DRAFT_406872 [Xylariaceae sp. FL0255]